MTENYPSFEEAKEGEFVSPIAFKSGDSFKVPMNRVRIHSEPDNEMTQHLHRTAQEYGLHHSDAAEIYNEINGHLADTHELDQETFEKEIESAVSDYAEGATASEVVESYGLDEPTEESYDTLEEIREEFS